VAVISRKTGCTSAPGGALIAAALALPGVTSTPTWGESVPQTSLFEAKYLDYRDWQPGADRMTVRSPSFYLSRPLSETVLLEAGLVYDAMSGASPLYYNTLSGASGLGGVTDYRTAGDVKVTKYFDNVLVGVSAAISSEQDYLSRAAALDVRVLSADRNRTYAFSFGGSGDVINSVNGVAENQHRHTIEYMVGVTQALSSESIIQSNLTYSYGHGYYSDPYKPLDTRPSERRIFAWLTRYNEHLPASDATLKLLYRYLHDSWGSISNTLEATWYQPLPRGFSVVPSVRYYTQSAANFYYNPPFPEGFVPGQDYTADTRLSAFGAFTVGATLGATLSDGWSATLKVDFSRQKSAWRIGGSGSPDIEPFSARWILLGFSKVF